jgi:hypothetical protein
MTNHDPMTAVDQVINILSLKHPKAGKALHPAVIGAAIYYVQKWSALNRSSPTKMAALDNGNISMIWEDSHPPVAIAVQAASQSAKIYMTSADGTTTEKLNEEGTDAKALETVVDILHAITAASHEQTGGEDVPETEDTVPAVVAG